MQVLSLYCLIIIDCEHDFMNGYKISCEYKLSMLPKTWMCNRLPVIFTVLDVCFSIELVGELFTYLFTGECNNACFVRYINTNRLDKRALNEALAENGGLQVVPMILSELFYDPCEVPGAMEHHNNPILVC